MRVKFILPALTEAKSPFWRPIKYSLFPPLGLATLAAFLEPDDEAELVDDHVEPLGIAPGALVHDSAKHRAKHFFYAAGWKKFEPLWDAVIKARRLAAMTPLLEGVLAKVSGGGPRAGQTCG